jgi:hypothetical protein
MFFCFQTAKGTPVRQILRQPEPEPGIMLGKVQVEPEGAVRNKIAELVDEVRLSVSSEWPLAGACYRFP